MLGGTAQIGAQDRQKPIGHIEADGIGCGAKIDRRRYRLRRMALSIENGLNVNVFTDQTPCHDRARDTRRDLRLSANPGR